MRKISRIVLVALIVQVIFGSFVASASTNSSHASSDISGHWAEATIKSWLDKGYINGYSDGSFRPNNKITRAEFVKIVNGVFQVEKSDYTLNYSDLPQSHWAYSEIAAAVQAGYVSGTTETTVSPDKVIARQEAAVMLVKLTGLKGSAELNFKDAANIPQWSKNAIEAIVAGGFMKGDTAGNFRAKDGLTRAEAVVLLDNISASLETKFEAAGQYGSAEQVTVINGDVRITAADVTLLNIEIKGNLIIDEAVGEGDVYLKQVKVSGSTIVNGGGENSVHLEDTIIVNLIVDKATGKVRIVASGSTSVQQVAVQSPVKLEESQTSEIGFQNIELTPSLPAGSDVELIGHFETVAIMAASIQVKIPSGSIGQLNVAEKASNNKIDLVEGVTVEKLILDIVAQIIGQGTINQAQVTPAAEQSTFETKPKQLEVVDPSGNPIPSPTPTPELIPDFPTIPTSPTTPTPTKTPQKSNDASIHSLTINEELVLNKHNWMQQQGKSIEGFATDHMQYYVDLPADEEEMEFKLNVKAEKNAEVSFYVTDYSVSHYGEPQEVENNQLTLNINSSKFYGISIYVTSESEKYTKVYFINLIGELDVQYSFNLVSYKINNTRVDYHLRSNLVKAGDQLIVTIPAEHSSTGQEIVNESTVTSSNGYAEGTYVFHSQYFYYLLKPSSNTGELGLKLVRNGITVYDGSYSFDITPIQYERVEQPLDNDLFKFNFVEREQLDQWNTGIGSYNLFAYEYNLALDGEEVTRLYPDAAYWNMSTQYDDVLFATSEQFIYDSVKPTMNYGYHTVFKFDDDVSGGVYFFDLNENADINEVVTGQIVRLHLFDENMQLIQAIKFRFDVPEQYLASNVVPKKSVTEDDLESVAVQLDDFITTPSFTWKKTDLAESEDELEIEGFDPTHRFYLAEISKELTDGNLNLQFDAVEGLEISVDVRSRSFRDLIGELVEYNDDQARAGIELTLEANMDYEISVSVEHPYTKEGIFYSFQLVGYRDYSEMFSISNNALIAESLKPGDIIEVELPAEYSTTGVAYQLTHTVSNELRTQYISLSDYYDEELEQEVSFSPTEVGSLNIKLTRQGTVLYEGELQFDYTPLPLLSGGTIQLLNDEERIAMYPPMVTPPDVAYRLDFSGIEGAAYTSNYFVLNAINALPDNEIEAPNKQSLGNRDVSATLKFTSSNTFRATELGKHLYVVYVIYDINSTPIGYVSLSAELTDEYVNDNKTIISPK